MKITRYKKQDTENKGFTLLFSVLVSVLILAVGASIINIALKQVILSGAGRESQFAFYAANTGLECALYWDLNPNKVGGVISYTFPATLLGQTQRNDTSAVTCAGGQIMNGVGFTDGIFTTSGYVWNANDYTFRISIGGGIPSVSTTKYCAEVNVKKSFNSSSGRITTTINSRGLNTCDENSPRAVERGLVLQYQS